MDSIAAPWAPEPTVCAPDMSPPPPPHAPPPTDEAPIAGGWARSSWATIQRASRSAKALFTRKLGPNGTSKSHSSEKRRSVGWPASLSLGGRERPDPSAEEEYGNGSNLNETMFSRPYALSSAHEEVVSAFASGQRRLAGQLARQQRWDPVAMAAAEREAHLAILRDNFGRGFLRKALKMVQEEETDEAAPLLGALPSAAAKQQASPAPVVSIHATAWSPPLATEYTAAAGPLCAHRQCSATHSFRLTAHTSTEDEEIDVEDSW